MQLLLLYIDAMVEDYYKAELLLFSLRQNVNWPKEQILIQCAENVDEEFLNFIDSEGYAYQIVSPLSEVLSFFDMKGSEAFDAVDISGLYLLDVDMFVVAPFDVPDSSRVWGRAGQKSNIIVPALGKVPESNNRIICGENQGHKYFLNSGFYYVPGRFIQDINVMWEKCAHSFSDCSSGKPLRMLDKLAMILAIESFDIPYSDLPPGFCFSVDNSVDQKALNDEGEVKLICYQNNISCFGIIETKRIKQDKALAVVEKANEKISEYGKFTFFSALKRKKVHHEYHEMWRYQERFNRDVGLLAKKHSKNLRIVLHAGAPKTGTKSLQFFLDRQKDELLAGGFFYPEIYLPGVNVPKHQWLVGCLLHKKFDELIEWLRKVLCSVPAGIHTVILSTEGLYNHWWDFDIEAKSFLAVLAKHFNVELWLFLRNPEAFVTSIYIQYIKNPRSELVAGYGCDLSIRDMMNDESFICRLDYLGYVYGNEVVFGKGNVKVYPYSRDVVSFFSAKMNLTLTSEISERKNTSLSEAGVELLRIINRYPLAPKDKLKIVEKVNEIDSYLSVFSGQIMLSDLEKQMVCKLTALGIHRLYIEYGIDLSFV